MNKTQRVVVPVDPELKEYLRQRSLTTRVPVSELVRRAINLTLHADAQAGREQHAQAH